LLYPVPTNYRIKVSKDKKPFLKDDDEDKNLGRWVNRQRSLFQAGKLRRDRQLSLEKIGLKWSMLATTSWDSMFETLEEYVTEKTRNGAKWDGNVPANYKTNDDPPRALGRWINRQRSAYGKKKLKREYESKLHKLGLKWSVHERKMNCEYLAKTTPDGVGSSVADEATQIGMAASNADKDMQHSGNNSCMSESAGAEVTIHIEASPEGCAHASVDFEESEEKTYATAEVVKAMNSTSV
jgi:hypothetical protein